mmetsp:Transcript_35744/g.54719  ORF Transcript_35744/g.54719 Transcript_35744/m.54719 type:complete len:84 (+) Transcript_35744:525-776(+)
MGILAIYAFSSPYLLEIEKAKLEGGEYKKLERSHNEGFMTSITRFILCGGEPTSVEVGWLNEIKNLTEKPAFKKPLEPAESMS